MISKTTPDGGNYFCDEKTEKKNMIEVKKLSLSCKSADNNERRFQRGTQKPYRFLCLKLLNTQSQNNMARFLDPPLNVSFHSLIFVTNRLVLDC